MKSYKELSYTDKIRLRTRALWVVLVLMLAYMVIVGEMGLGDSRIMTPLADMTSRVIFFGGIAYVGACIVRNKKLLRDRAMLAEQRRLESDERRQFLHDKSGGLVLDALLIAMLFVTCTAALWNMAAFYATLILLLTALALKLGAHTYYSRNY